MTVFVVLVSSLSSLVTSVFLNLYFAKNTKTIEPIASNDILGEQTDSFQIEETTSTQSAQMIKENIELADTEPAPEPTENKVKLGIVVDDYANKHNSIPDLEEQLGAKISTVSIFKQFGHQYNKDLILEDLEYIKSSGKVLMISWEPWDPDKGLTQDIDYLTEIVNGNFDNYIQQFANQIKTYNSPVIIRFAHEMNGNWYPWGNRPEEYRRTYIYLHNKLTQLGVSNVKWMWAVNSDSVPTVPATTLSKYYPGDQYVDIIGIDGFNFGTSQDDTNWRSFDQIFSESYSFLSSNYNKPIVIAEMGASELGGDKSSWIIDMFERLANEYSNIEEIIWFNLLKETDWRIESTQSSLNSFKTSLTD